MSYRNDYINRHKSATEQRIAEQQAANTEMTNQYIQDINSVIDKSTDAAVNKVQGEIDKLPTTYQSTFDANAVNQKINERKLANRMENLGLTDSGLNRTQQTALTIQRANADAATRQQMNAASLSLKQQIADIISQGESKKAENAATAKYNLAQQNQSIYNSLMDELYSNADSYANSQNRNSNGDGEGNYRKVSLEERDEILNKVADVYDPSIPVEEQPDVVRLFASLETMGYDPELLTQIAGELTVTAENTRDKLIDTSWITNWAEKFKQKSTK